MDKTFTNLLLKFPLQEMNNTSEQFRSFAIPFVDKVDNSAVYTELFQYSDLKRKYKINEKEYSFDDQNLDDLIETLFQEISKGEELCNQNQNNFAYLDDTKVYFLDIKQKDDNPLNDDYFDEWYDLIVLNNNPD